MTVVYVLAAIVAVGLIGVRASVRVVQQFERGVVFRFGQVRDRTRGPGLALITPVVDRLQKVNLQIVTLPVPAQDGITRDNVTVRVDAVVYYRVVDRVRVAVDVQDYGSAILLTRRLNNAPGPVVAVSDWMRAVPDQIASFIPGSWSSLGTDGFGRSDTRPALRRHFGIDAPSIVLRTLEQLIAGHQMDGSVRDKALDAYGFDPAGDSTTGTRADSAR